MLAESTEFERPSEFALQYEALMGRWSRAMAARFITWLAPLPHQRWLDVGCGTGALTEAILKRAAPKAVWAVDAEPQYIQQAGFAIRDRRCRFVVADALHLPADIADVDLTVSGLFLNLIPNPAAGLAEMLRVSRVGGRVATYLWDFARGMQFVRHFWDAAIELDRGAESLDQGRRYPLCHPDRLRELFVAGGLRFADLQALEIPTVFRSFDDYWMPIELGHGRASEYFGTLGPQQRVRLRERIKARLPTNADGSIALSARAWVIAGQRGS
jgi:SAM-dependent methyltransferase